MVSDLQPIIGTLSPSSLHSHASVTQSLSVYHQRTVRADAMAPLDANTVTTVKWPSWLAYMIGVPPYDCPHHTSWHVTCASKVSNPTGASPRRQLRYNPCPMFIILEKDIDCSESCIRLCCSYIGGIHVSPRVHKSLHHRHVAPLTCPMKPCITVQLHHYRGRPGTKQQMIHSLFADCTQCHAS
jgi:hypothetical protein